MAALQNTYYFDFHSNEDCKASVPSGYEAVAIIVTNDGLRNPQAIIAGTQSAPQVMAVLKAALRAAIEFPPER